MLPLQCPLFLPQLGTQIAYFSYLFMKIVVYTYTVRLHETELLADIRILNFGLSRN